MRWLAAVLSLALAGAASAGPAFVFSGEGWEMPIGQPEVYAFQSFRPASGGVGLLVTLKEPAAEALAAHTAAHLGEPLTLLDGDGGVLLETVLAEPISRRFAVSFGDPEAAQRAARRMQGQE
jgi:hypothetical protein